jgi:gas vesicle protein
MHYEDDSRGLNLITGLLFGTLVGSAVALLSRALGRIQLRRPPSRTERMRRQLGTLSNEARDVVSRVRDRAR